MINDQAIGLASLVEKVKQTLQTTFEIPVWVVAEIMEINLNRSGHCYLELIEKDTLSDKIIAKTRATIWSYAYRMIKPYFESTTGESLQAGLKVLIRVTVEFHEVYGFSLNIQDIDPQYTLGDMARQRALVIEQLKIDGIFDMNRQVELPLVPQRIAVVTSDTAAGWGDFSNQLANNPFGYHFEVSLFTAVMQGDKAPASIIEALNNIFENIGQFDVVAIMRGGGSKSDLLCFDNYELASHIAQFPIPVLTGIGHERDDSVADLVAHTRLKTPTALAAFLIEKVNMFEQQLQLKCDMVFEGVQQILEEKINEFDELSRRLAFANKQLMNYQEEKLQHLQVLLVKGCRQYIHNQTQFHRFLTHQARIAPLSALRMKELNLQQLRHHLALSTERNFLQNIKNLGFYQSKLKLLDPVETLKRGYAIVRHNGKLVKQVEQVNEGDMLSVQLSNGSINSHVI